MALTDFQRQLMVQGGLPAERIGVIPNFLEPDPGRGSDSRAGLLFVGRLTQEKGVPALLQATGVVPGIVSVAGDGPLTDLAEQADAAGHIAYLGQLTRSSVADHIRRTTALILPSVWFEGLPLVLIEAFASGTPVIASRIGSLAELIDDGVTGLFAEPGNVRDLADADRGGLAITRAKCMRWAATRATGTRRGSGERRTWLPCSRHTLAPEAAGWAA